MFKRFSLEFYLLIGDLDREDTRFRSGEEQLSVDLDLPRRGELEPL